MPLIASPAARWLPLGLLLLGGIMPAKAAPPSAVRFDRDIRPIFAEHCLACHGTDEAEGGLRLTDRTTATSAADSGLRPVVPGDPDHSELLRRVTAADPAERMPPEGKDPLSPAEVARLRQWIAEGAVWSGHWSFQPLVRPEPPAVAHEAWVRNDLDRYVLARIEAAGLDPSPEAGRYTLIKRLSYDLLGLPPSIEEVDAFVSDPSPGAYETLVERLLQSPHFGERWGRHWLDLAHYADSDGYEKDRARPDAYLFRDWVIQAINDDLPFDQFTIQQLAGDLLPGATARQKLATAFNRQTLTNEEGGVDQEEYRVAAVFDRAETLGTVWLGLTVGCARCHTHKYDPISHAEYYQLFAFFNEAEELASPLPLEARELAELEARTQPLEAQLQARYTELAPQAHAWEAEQHQRIMAQTQSPLQEQPLELAAVQTATGGEVHLGPEGVQVAGGERDTYSIILASLPGRVTGFKLVARTDDRLPQRGPGHSSGGNFVLTSFQVFVEREGAEPQAIALHRPKADYSQAGFPAESVLQDTEGKGGWAVGGKTGEPHWIQLRTREPLELIPGSRVRIVLDQQYGGHHTLGRFQLLGLTGDERGLQLERQDIADALEMYPEKRVVKTRELLFDYYVTEVARDERVRELRQEIARLQQEHAARLVTVRTLGTPRLPRSTHIFDRGDFLSRKEAVEPATLAVLPPLQPRGARADRLDLARWLVSPDNPLPPRVAVNQVWKHLFGEGLVRTMSDFGLRGESPTHADLLDALADRFRSDLQWRRKELIRLIVTSATYRQASRHRPEVAAVDPLNTLLARQNRFRVEGEIVRDLHLAASGLLTRQVGGPSVFPPMPDDLAKLSYANNFSWQNSAGADRYRRGMYTFFKRTIPHPNLTTFDCPDANVACVSRTVSNTPLQALTLLNNEVHLEAARALAQRVLRGDSADEARLVQLVRLCIARPPQPEELQLLAQLLARARSHYTSHPEAAREFAGPGATTDSAAWTSVARIVLNLDETITRE